MGEDRTLPDTDVVDEAPGSPTGARVRQSPKLPGHRRRTQLVSVATRLFSRSGLHGTTTQALAKAAGVTEPVLYAHFSSKDELFRTCVETNSEARLRALDHRLQTLNSPAHTSELIGGLAQETVNACVSPATNVMLMHWALLETPDYAVDLHRSEAGAIEMMWEREVRRGELSSASTFRFILPFLPQAVNVCLAYGFWLSSLRHTPATTRDLACHYARAVAWMAFNGPDGAGGRDTVSDSLGQHAPQQPVEQGRRIWRGDFGM
jgi:AcrR family transcriptional regulator